jgi:hypothetical protein
MVMGNLTSNFFIKVDKSRLTNKTPPAIACEVQRADRSRDARHSSSVRRGECYKVLRQVRSNDAMMSEVLTRIFHKLARALTCLLINKKDFAQSGVWITTLLFLKTSLLIKILRDHHANLWNIRAKQTRNRSCRATRSTLCPAGVIYGTGRRSERPFARRDP